MATERISHPGIIFPDMPEHPKNVLSRHKYKRRPRPQNIQEDVSIDWGVTTNQISYRYGLSVSSVRQYLHRHHVEYKLIRQAMTGPAVLFWNREEALGLFKGFPLKTESVPEGYMMTREAQHLLNVSNTTLLRLAEMYDIPSKLIRLVSQGKNRHRRVYQRDALLKTRKLFYAHPCFTS